MKKSKFLIAILAFTLALGLIMTGCSSDKKEGQIPPVEDGDKDLEETPEKDGEQVGESDENDSAGLENINLSKAIEETMEEISEVNFVDDVYIMYVEPEEKISFIIVVEDDTEEDLALEFANEAIKIFSSKVEEQNSDLEPASEDYFGEVFDHYNIGIGVAAKSKTSEIEDWYVDEPHIEKGSHTKLELNN